MTRKEREQVVERKVHRVAPGCAFLTWCGRHTKQPREALGSDTFAQLPASAQCRVCARPWPPGRNYRSAPAELMLAVEAALSLIAKQMQTWPDAWQIDPHGTGNNPHVWFDASGGSSWAGSLHMCPCGATKYEPFLRVPRRHGKMSAPRSIVEARSRKP